MIDAGVEWAIQAFDSLGPEEALTPAQRFELCFRYDIKKWIMPAVSGLVDRQFHWKLLRLISNDEIDQMGIRIYNTIVRGIENIYAARTKFAINCPPSYHDSEKCPDTASCDLAWRTFWFMKVAPSVLANNGPISLGSIIPTLEKEKIENFHEACQKLTLVYFASSDEHNIVTAVKNKVVSEIMKLF